MRREYVATFRFALTISPLLALSSCGRDEGFELERVLVHSAPTTGGVASAGATGNGGGTSIPSGGGAGQGTTSPSPDNLAVACGDDNDCPSGLNCLASGGSDWLGGGPPGGVCTVSCEFDSECEEFDVDGVCVGNGAGAAYCFPGCILGTEQPLGEVKCQDRNTLACSPAQSFGNVCQPTCGSDLDCAGRRCDLATGSCVDEVVGTKALGEECDPDAEDPGCAGGCIELVQGWGVCSGICNFGVNGCGLDPSEDIVRGDPICLPIDAMGGLGDVGFCIQRCDCDGDCRHPGAVCSEFTNDATKEALSAQGLCFPSTLTQDSGEPIEGLPCEGGASDSGAPNLMPDGG